MLGKRKEKKNDSIAHFFHSIKDVCDVKMGRRREE